MRRRLVRNGERVAQVLHRDASKVLRLGEESHGVGLGQQYRGREVVRLDALPQKVGVVGGLLVAEQVTREGLHDRAAGVARGRLLGRQVDAAVLLVGHRPRRVRQVGHVVQGEPEVQGHVADELLAHGAAAVADGVEEFASLRLELGEVVVASAHRGSQLRIRASRLLRRRRSLLVQPLDLLVQRQDRAEGLVAVRLRDAERMDAESFEHRTALRPLDGDLEGRTFVRRFLVEKIVDCCTRASASCRSIESRGSRFPFSIIDTCDGARSMARPSCSSVIPRETRKSRTRRPSVSASTRSAGPSSGVRASAVIMLLMVTRCRLSGNEKNP